jgi:hypothetical protein
MKTKVKLLFSVGLLTPLFGFAPIAVMAQNSEEHAQAQVLQAEQETTSDDEAPVNQAELKARLEQRKTALKTRLTFAKQARIRNLCKASQGGISNIRGRIKGLETSRTQVYENLLDRLTKLSEKLQTHDVDTTEFDAQITELTTMIETFNTNLASYEQAVSDLADMDCAADPTAFQASLEAARTERAETAESAKTIRAFLSETVKPTLSELRQQFAQGASSESDNEAETEGGETE